MTQNAVRGRTGGAPSPASCAATGDLISVLSHGACLDILTALATGEQCVSVLAEVLGADVSAVSRDLRRLRERDLVAVRREKKHHLYRLSHRVESAVVGCRIQLMTRADDGGRLMLEIPIRFR